jgi:hypothetical protein
MRFATTPPRLGRSEVRGLAGVSHAVRSAGVTGAHCPHECGLVFNPGMSPEASPVIQLLANILSGKLQVAERTLRRRQLGLEE